MEAGDSAWKLSGWGAFGTPVREAALEAVPNAPLRQSLQRRLVQLGEGSMDEIEGDTDIHRNRAIAQSRERAKTLERQREKESAAERMAAAKAKEQMIKVLKLIDPLPGRISELVSRSKVASGRITVDDGDWRALAFLEKELRTIVAALHQLPMSAVPGQEHEDHQYLAPFIKDRLVHLRDLADWIQNSILNGGRAPRRAAELPELNLAWIEQLLLADGFAAAGGHTVGGSDMRTVLPSKRSDNHHEQLLQPEPEYNGNPHLVGIDGPSKKLHRWLVSAADGEDDDKNTLRVISIVGPAGVGKTTLAMELYRRIGGQHFQCHAAARMSRQAPDTRKLLRHIMSQIIDSAAAAPETPDCSKTMTALQGDEHELAFDLKKLLEDKRYLIVIDDLWRETDWEIIEDVFPRNKCGSRILITTRDRSVARSFSSDKDVHPNSRKGWGRNELVHEVKHLGMVDSERLFSRVAFGAGGSCPSDHLKQAMDEILTRCAGIPLFIIAVAGFISMRQNQADGLDDKTAASWLEQIPELILELAEEALSPSFHHLPDELKLLSLHMSTFPRGYIIDKRRLFRKWGAEGLIAADMWTAFEELAEEHFGKLFDCGIIRPTERRYASEETVDCYQVDHFMHPFLASISAQKNFAMTSGTINFKAVAGAEGDKEAWKLQRLFLHQPDPELSLMLEKMDFSHTRSLTVSGAANRIPFNKFVHLVVLDLEGWQKLGNDLVVICSSNFFVLKYLSVRNTRVSKLPPQIAKMECLETLDISHTQIIELPLEVLELPQLLVLDLRNTQVRRLSRYETSLRPGLRHLLINGDKPDETVTVVPEDIVHWRFLETLETVDLSNCSTSFIKDLAKLRFLEVLAVTWSFRQCYDEEYQRALQSAIQRSVCLKSLTIHCEVGCSMEFLDLLPDAPQSLEHLRITARFLTVPKWIEGLNHLVFLDITVCKLAPHDINVLGCLKILERLVLYLDFLQEKVILFGHEGFHQLQKLSVNCRVPWLEFSIGAMPRLTDLDLILSTGPASQESKPSGISNLVSLEQVSVRYDPWYINCRSVKAALGAMRSQIADLGHTVKFVNNGVEEDVGTILAEMCN